MDDKVKLALSALGLMMLYGSFSWGNATVTLFMHAWDMTVALGFREVFGYLVATGVVGILSVLTIPMFFVFSLAMTIGPWTEGRSK
ncbi:MULTISPECIES: hypothetical protein [Pseudomonas]|jgi:hypothetical protein|uniref:hypothetical protein n=1 Tax=Pseudomonas TaxID=286 RepID=UPI00093ED81C|nr:MULTISPECIES: hypothetical protein [Pseudomonas]MDA3395737.1 hypothetical protein [Pseudomonas aeruginosa]HCT5749967.1 hypothetical protein [Pseudomonas aeruginosa]